MSKEAARFAEGCCNRTERGGGSDGSDGWKDWKGWEGPDGIGKPKELDGHSSVNIVFPEIPMSVQCFTTAGRVLTIVTSYRAALACGFAIEVRVGLRAR